MKTNLRNKMILGLSAVVIVLTMTAANSFADRGDRGDRDSRGDRDRIVYRDRDGGHGDRDRDGWRGDRDRFRGGVNFGWDRPVYVYRPYTYYPVYSAPVIVQRPFVCQPAYSSISFFFSW